MSFYVIAKEREDGDWDSLCAFVSDGEESYNLPSKSHTLEVLEWLRSQDDETYKVFHLANVDDVISADLAEQVKDSPDAEKECRELAQY